MRTLPGPWILALSAALAVATACETFSTMAPPGSAVDGGGVDGIAPGPDAGGTADGSAEAALPDAAGGFSCGAHPSAALCDDFNRLVVLESPPVGVPWGFIGSASAPSPFSLVAAPPSPGKVLEFHVGEAVTAYLKQPLSVRSTAISLSVRIGGGAGGIVVLAALPYAAPTGIGAVKLVAEATSAPGKISVHVDNENQQKGTVVRLSDIFTMDTNTWHRFEILVVGSTDATRIEGVTMDGQSAAFAASLLPAPPTELQVGALPLASMPPTPWLVNMDDVLIEPR